MLTFLYLTDENYSGCHGKNIYKKHLLCNSITDKNQCIYDERCEWRDSFFDTLTGKVEDYDKNNKIECRTDNQCEDMSDTGREMKCRDGKCLYTCVDGSELYFTIQGTRYNMFDNQDGAFCPDGYYCSGDFCLENLSCSTYECPDGKIHKINHRNIRKGLNPEINCCTSTCANIQGVKILGKN